MNSAPNRRPVITRGRLDRLRELSLCDWAVLSQLVASCIAITIALRTFGWRRGSRGISSASDTNWARVFPLFQFRYSVADLDPLVEMASSVCRRNRCLVRSMILFWLLRAHGESAELVLGIRKRAGAFEAHAWTLSQSGLVGDRPETIADFQTIMSFGKQER
jgi:hypothetical protein